MKETEKALTQSENILNEPIKVRTNDQSDSHSTIKTFTTDEIHQLTLRSKLSDKKNYLEPSRWIYLFNECFKIKFIYKTDSVTKDGIRIDMNTYKAFVRTQVKEMGLSRYFNKQTVDDIILLWVDEERRRFLKDIRSNLTYSKPQLDLIELWVKAATGKADVLTTSVMRHFVWQVRRKIYGLPVEHHMMPILYGKSGGGKSQAVLKLLHPLDSLCLNMDLSIFSDQFRTRLFNKAYIMFFDEMAKSERADIDRLKNIITSPTVDFRGMHSENLESAPQNCTFIGCSNDTVYDKIYDPTSARRYWQIDCSDKLDWMSINSIDYFALWKSIDENSACPIASHLLQISQVQDKTIRNKDLIEDWVNAILTPGNNDPRTNPTSLELYESFKQHCVFQKINNVPTFNKFTRRLPQIMQYLKWNVGPRRTNRGTLWALQINPSFDSRVKLQEVLDLDAQLKEQSKVADFRAKITK